MSPNRSRSNLATLVYEPLPDKPAASTSHEVLLELFNLLEEYAPVWYTEELHNRAVAALGKSE